MKTPHQFRFTRWLETGPWQAGIAFHRWLPDGEKDALRLKTEEPGAQVLVWCERFGKMEGQMIRFEHRVTSFDSATIPKQGMLAGGPLYGRLVCDLSADDAAALANGGERAERIGKRLLQLVETPGIRLVGVLRRQFGQHWLRDWAPWDSRRGSIQSALSAIQLEWKGPGGDWPEWQPVRVGRHEVVLNGSVPAARDFLEFVTEADWRLMEHLVNEARSSPAVEYLGMAHENLASNLRLALIDSVTACELALSECLGGAPEFSKQLERFWNLPLPSQLVAAVAAKGLRLEASVLTDALAAIKLRNQVVHEGWSPTESGARQAVKGMLLTVQALLGVWPMKFPRLAGNWVRPETDWEKETRSWPTTSSAGDVDSSTNSEE